MAMQDIAILNFWNRFDSLRRGTLDDVSKETGIPVGTLKNLRTRKLLPKLVDAVALAEYLNVSLDWLVLGKVSENLNDKLIISYSKADELTKMMINRLLNIS